MILDDHIGFDHTATAIASTQGILCPGQRADATTVTVWQKLKSPIKGEDDREEEDHGPDAKWSEQEDGPSLMCNSAWQQQWPTSKILNPGLLRDARILHRPLRSKLKAAPNSPAAMETAMSRGIWKSQSRLYIRDRLLSKDSMPE